MAKDLPPKRRMILPIINNISDPNSAGQNFTQNSVAPKVLLMYAMNDSMGGTSKNPQAR